MTELENFKVWSGGPEPAVDFHAADDAHARVPAAAHAHVEGGVVAHALEEGRERERRAQDDALVGRPVRPREPLDERTDERGLRGTSVIQRRFNVSVPRARVTENTSTLRDRSER